MTTRILNHDLEASEIDLLVGELEKLEIDRATQMAERLRRAPERYEPSLDDLHLLARALDHLRNLDVIPSGSRLLGLRDSIIGAYGSRRYRLDPQTGEPSFGSFSYGPIHAEGDRLVDFRTGREWFVGRIEPDTDPIEIVVAPWRPRAERV